MIVVRLYYCAIPAINGVHCLPRVFEYTDGEDTTEQWSGVAYTGI